MQGYFGYPQRPIDQRRVLSSSFTRNLQFSVTTILGSTESGYRESNVPLSARFNNPKGLEVFKNNTLFIVDTENHCFRTFTLLGGTSKLSGRLFKDIPQFGDTSGDSNTSSYNRPRSLVLTREGNLIVLDTENHSIKAIDAIGNSILLAGNGTQGDVSGQSTNARLNFPQGMCLLSNGDVVFCDTGNHKIKRLDTSNNVSTIAGSTVGFTNSTNPLLAQFNQPSGVAVDSNQNLYICDKNNNAIRKITPERVTTTFAGGSEGDLDSPGVQAKLKLPTDIVLGFRNELYFVDSGNKRIKRVSNSGTVSTLFGYDPEKSGGSVLSRLVFDAPGAITLDVNGDIYIADGNRIKKLTLLP